MSNYSYIYVSIILVLLSQAAIAENHPSLEEIRAEVPSKLDLDNPDIADTAMTIASEHPGDYNINQVCAIYNTLSHGGWYYYSEASDRDYFQNANLTLQRGKVSNTIGRGDCDDFAILMTSLIESLGGSTRISFAYDLQSKRSHAYTEIYLGEKDSKRASELIDWLKKEYNLAEISGLNETDNEVWLNLDWGSNYPGGPYFGNNSKNVKIEIVRAATTRISPKIVPLIDSMDSTDDWRAADDNKGSNINISSTPGLKGNAISISYDLREDGWVEILKDIDPEKLSATNGLNFSCFNMGSQKKIEARITCEDGNAFGISWILPTGGGKWSHFQTLYQDFICLQPGSGYNRNLSDSELDPIKARRIEIIVSDPNKGNTSGTILIDEIRGVMAIPSGSPWEQMKKQRQKDLSRELTSQAKSLLNQRGDQLPLSTLLILEALQRDAYWENKQVLYNQLSLLPLPVAYMDLKGPVYDIAFSPDGRYLATIGSHEGLRVWDLLENKTIALKDIGVEAICFSPDGALLAAAGWNRSIKLWSVPDFNETIIPELGSHVIEDLAFSPDGRYLALADFNVTKIIDINSYQQIKQFDQGGRLTSISFSPDGSRLATAGENKKVWIWDIEGGHEIYNLDDDLIISSVAISPDGRYLATTSGFDAKIWDIEDKPEKVLQLTHNDNVNAIVFSPSGRYIATASNDNTARLWDVMTGEEVTRMVHEGYVSALAFSPDGKYISTASWDNSSRIWEARGWDGLTSVEHNIGYKTQLYFNGSGLLMATTGGFTSQIWRLGDNISEILSINTSPANNLALSPEGKHIALAHFNGTVSIWNIADNEKIAAFDQEGNSTLLLFSRDGRYLASGTEAGSVKIIELNSGQQVGEVSHEGPVLWAAFSPKGENLTTLSVDGKAVVFDIDSNSVVKQLVANGTWNFGLSSDGRYIASCYWTEPSKDFLQDLQNLSVDDLTNMTIKHWIEVVDIASGNIIQRIPCDVNGNPGMLKLSKDGRYIAAPVFNYAEIWEVNSGKQIAKFGHTGIVSNAAISYDGRYLAATNDKGVVWIWDVNTGKELTHISHGAALFDFIFSPDGKYLATLDMNSKIRLWPLDAKEMIKEAYPRLFRSISDDQWLNYLGSEPVNRACQQANRSGCRWIGPEYKLGKMELAPKLVAEPLSVSPGEMITVEYSGAPGNKGDWIAMYRLGDKSENYDEYYFLGSNTSGKLHFKAPEEEGLYHFRLVPDWPTGGYNEIAISNSVHIVQPSSPVSLQPTTASLPPDLPSPQQSGQATTWTATTSDPEPIQQITDQQIADQYTDYQGAKDWYDKGTSFFFSGQYEDAIVCYDEALKIDPADVNAWIAKGNALNSLSRYDEAIECYDNALAIDPYSELATIGKNLSLWGKSMQSLITGSGDQSY